MWSAIAGLITSGINAWSESRQQKADLKRLSTQGQMRIEKARVDSHVKRAEQGDTAAICLDQLSFQHRGWKDDYLLMLTTAPLLLLFVAPLFELVLLQNTYQSGALVAAVMSGFTALQETPDWYLGALLLVYVDTFGFRRLLRGVIENRLGGIARMTK